MLDLPYTYAPDGNLEIIEIDNRKQIIEAHLLAPQDGLGAIVSSLAAPAHP